MNEVMNLVAENATKGNQCFVILMNFFSGTNAMKSVKQQ
jgi:hypothetical protein